MPKLLKAPAGHASVCVNGKQYDVDSRGYVEVEDNDVASVMAHDARFVLSDGRAPVGEGGDAEARRAIDDLASQTAKAMATVHDRFEELHKAAAEAGREALFAHLKALGVVVNRTTKTDDLRVILETEVSKAEAKAAEDEKAAGGTKPDAV